MFYSDHNTKKERKSERNKGKKKVRGKVKIKKLRRTFNIKSLAKLCVINDSKKTEKNG